MFSPSERLERIRGMKDSEEIKLLLEMFSREIEKLDTLEGIDDIIDLKARLLAMQKMETFLFNVSKLMTSPIGTASEDSSLPIIKSRK